jgi:hypothetical protein
LQYNADNGLTSAIVANTRRYVELFSEVLDGLLKDATPADHAIRSEEVADVLQAHRLQRIAAAAAEAGENPTDNPDLSLPVRLVRRCVDREVPVNVPVGSVLVPVQV